MKLPFKEILNLRSRQPEEIPIKEVSFVLLYDDLEVGRLFRENDMWCFVYSEDFKDQSAINPLINFPDTTRIYRDVSLPPFFESRIPSPSHPKIRKRMEAEGVEAADKAGMLRLFGRRTLTNSFVLQPS